jgi:hypothetical protein
MWFQVIVAQQWLPTLGTLRSYSTAVSSNSGTYGPFVAKMWQTNMGRPLRYFSLMLGCDEHIKIVKWWRIRFHMTWHVMWFSAGSKTLHWITVSLFLLFFCVMLYLLKQYHYCIHMSHVYSQYQKHLAYVVLQNQHLKPLLALVHIVITKLFCCDASSWATCF